MESFGPREYCRGVVEQLNQALEGNLPELQGQQGATQAVIEKMVEMAMRHHADIPSAQQALYGVIEGSTQKRSFLAKFIGGAMRAITGEIDKETSNKLLEIINPKKVAQLTARIEDSPRAGTDTKSSESLRSSPAGSVPSSAATSLSGSPRSSLENDAFHDRLMEIAEKDGALKEGVTAEQIAQLTRTYEDELPEEGWDKHTEDLYLSLRTEFLSRRWGLHLDAHGKLQSVLVGGCELPIVRVPDNGDCLFYAFIQGRDHLDQKTPDPTELRHIASDALMDCVNRFRSGNPREGDDTLIYQMASLMEIHEDVRGGDLNEDFFREMAASDGLQAVKDQFQGYEDLEKCATIEEFLAVWRRQHAPPVEVFEQKEPDALAEDYAVELRKPKTVYPGQETIQALAEHFGQTVLLMYHGNPMYYGPEPTADNIPVVLVKLPGNAHYDVAVIDENQWQLIRPK